MMRADLKTFRHFATVCGLIASLSCAPAAPEDEGERPYMPPDVYANNTHRTGNFVRNPDFKPVTPEIGTARFALSQEGEVLIVEGDARTVAGDAVGGFGITEDNARAIIQDVLAEYPDEFDTLQFYPTFFDQAAGTSAFYFPIANSVKGIGAATSNRRPDFGLPEEGRLSGWSNMNDIQLFASFDTATIPKGPYYSVIAQELSHRWLMYLKYVSSTGQLMEDLVGRQQAHWSALVHAYGSCQDGIFWHDNGDDTFTHMGESDNGFAPFDKYAMGLIPPEAVEETFKITEPTLNGNPIEATSHSELHSGSVVHGHRFPISIDQVRDVKALGPRNPPAGTESPYYRVAFVLVTAPGQSRTEWEPYLTTLKEVQETFPATWKEWTEGAGAICTRVSSRCPEPVIGLESFKALDGNDNNLAPGESFELALAIRNEGIGTAEGVRVEVSVLDEGVELNGVSSALSPPIAEGESAELTHLTMKIADGVECNTVVRLQVKEITQEGPSFTQNIELPVGTRIESYDAIEEAPDWLVNPEGTDTASTGAWALGQTQFISVLGRVLQPGEDHTPGRGKLSFGTAPSTMGSPTRGDVDRGKTTLESPVFALRGMRDPSLVFYVWHVAKDFTKDPPADVDGAELVIRGTDDNGETWKEMFRFTDNTEQWTRLRIQIKDFLDLTNKVRFRFEIEEPPSPGIDPLIEAGIDDVSIIDYLEVCNLPGGTPDAGVVDSGMLPGGGDRDKGCGCSVAGSRGENDGFGAGESVGSALMFGLLLLARSRRPGPGPGPRSAHQVDLLRNYRGVRPGSAPRSARQADLLRR